MESSYAFKFGWIGRLLGSIESVAPMSSYGKLEIQICRISFYLSIWLFCIEMLVSDLIRGDLDSQNFGFGDVPLECFQWEVPGQWYFLLDSCTLSIDLIVYSRVSLRNNRNRIEGYHSTRNPRTMKFVHTRKSMLCTWSSESDDHLADLRALHRSSFAF